MQYSLDEVTQAVLATAKLRPAEQSALMNLAFVHVVRHLRQDDVCRGAELDAILPG